MDDDRFLMLSGLHHFAYCRRSWSLIHIEQQWADNVHTAEGEVFHHRAHDQTQTEVRGDTVIMRGLRVQSQRLGVTGVCDVVEFRHAPEGIALAGREGTYSVYPVEYKKGAPKLCEGGNADALQLCAQAMCLEEMLCCTVEEGSLFYGETRRRERVPLTAQLRQTVEQMLEEMHAYDARGYTPNVKPHKGCSGCSLSEICLPKMKRAPTVAAYLRDHLHEEDAP